jgi:hypothetical protein
LFFPVSLLSLNSNSYFLASFNESVVFCPIRRNQ